MAVRLTQLPSLEKTLAKHGRSQSAIPFGTGLDRYNKVHAQTCTHTHTHTHTREREREGERDTELGAAHTCRRRCQRTGTQETDTRERGRERESIEEV